MPLSVVVDLAIGCLTGLVVPRRGSSLGSNGPTQIGENKKNKKKKRKKERKKRRKKKKKKNHGSFRS